MVYCKVKKNVVYFLMGYRKVVRKQHFYVKKLVSGCMPVLVQKTKPKRIPFFALCAIGGVRKWRFFANYEFLRIAPSLMVNYSFFMLYTTLLCAVFEVLIAR